MSFNYVVTDDVKLFFLFSMLQLRLEFAIYSKYKGSHICVTIEVFANGIKWNQAISVLFRS